MIRCTLLSCLILVSTPLPCRADIVVPDSVPVGTPTIVEIDDEIPAEADADYAFILRPKKENAVCGLREIDGTNKAYIWGSAGTYEVSGVVAVAGLDGIDIKFYDTVHIRTGDHAPIPPDPVDDNLAELVTPEQAAILTEFHEDAAYSVVFDGWPSREKFNESYYKRRAEINLQGVEKAYTVIDAQLRAVEGVGTELAKVLDGIADQLSVAPQPEPPEPGGSYDLVFFAKTDDLDKLSNSQRMILTSRTVRSQLSAAGHTFVLLIDDDEIERDATEKWRPWIATVKGDPLPRVAIRKKGGTVIKDYPLPNDYNALLRLLASPN